MTALTFTKAHDCERWDAQQPDGEYVAYIFRADRYGDTIFVGRIRDPLGGDNNCADETTLAAAMHKVTSAWAHLFGHSP